ncbi:hypothetical protein IPC665_31220 [Pseudomonas aeruginosa]|uniref:hypothetical protein n=1 Tax=Pseudomonas aeruginosa TaxID=287 RepID=UPI00071D1856|nr:hypothetical protein [Pseudomonas aeruginosa]KSP56904.1 hypothetical protein APB19_05925 [Pseudomonas aeruginosa]MBG4421579.1 hypothetical protein [Pseudomonas aeruginosa]RPY64584.1 hypothetical protein IPC665_31220 [Pseudomonas aeruginosa]
MTRRIGAKALGDQLYSYIGAIQDLATAVHQDMGFDGSADPAPRLTGDQREAILLSITTLATLAHGDLVDLLTEMEVPA